MKNAAALPLPTRILQAAFITFAEQGYDKASMDEVAEAAGTTKRTVYAHFTNKETLFRAAIGKAVEWFLAELPALDPAGDPETELARFAGQFSDLSTWRRPVLLQRVVIGESARLPDLGEMLHRDVILQAEGLVAAYLLARHAPGAVPAGQAPEDWAAAMARLYLNMATGPQRIATLMQAREPAPVHPSVGPSGTDRDWIALATRFFLAGLAGMVPPRQT